MKNSLEYTCTLSIAGSDTIGGAGIQADIKTFSALGCYATSVLTSLTAQNSRGVSSIFEITPLFIENQLKAVLSDQIIQSTKIGMLYSEEIIQVVAWNLNQYKVDNIVLDPVMISKNGNSLLKESAQKALVKYLFPLTRVLTPNLPEAQSFLNKSLNSDKEIEMAAQTLSDWGPPTVVIKGGHRASIEKSRDCIYHRESQKIIWIESKRIHTNNTHGTGCTFSAAISAYLAKEFPVITAIEKAKNYLTHAIERGAYYKFGDELGHGPVFHFHEFW
jgi:hydroxymethylpyrimidine/phosphomethylpyrimidine kinase